MRQMRLGFTGALLLLLPATSTAAEFSVQEALLRAKPAVALVLAEVGSGVLVTCGGRGERVVPAPPVRENGPAQLGTPRRTATPEAPGLVAPPPQAARGAHEQ